jgi:hypothetical protein
MTTRRKVLSGGAIALAASPMMAAPVVGASLPGADAWLLALWRERQAREVWLNASNLADTDWDGEFTR